MPFPGWVSVFGRTRAKTQRGRQKRSVALSSEHFSAPWSRSGTRRACAVLSYGFFEAQIPLDISSLASWRLFSKQMSSAHSQPSSVNKQSFVLFFKEKGLKYDPSLNDGQSRIFQTPRELILEHPDLDAFVLRQMNYLLVTTPWYGHRNCVRKEALGPFSWIWCLNNMSCLWPSILGSMFTERAGPERWGRKGHQVAWLQTTAFSGFMEQSAGPNLPPTAKTCDWDTARQQRNVNRC